ncbi:MAG: T9SS type A sorting domain-containing protein, partial [Bacteroidota bacterium]
DVVKVNICIENSSLTKNGNDFGVDNISFRECTNTEVNSDQFEELLKGNSCELAAGPEQLRLTAPQGLQMLDFTGKLIGEDVFLDWMVVVDDFVDQYEVQRSADGEHFTSIGGVDGKSQQNTLTQYAYVDPQVPQNTRFLYYRLKIRKRNGTQSLGPVIRVDISSLKNLDLTLITNPTKSGDLLEIQFNVPEANVQVNIHDIVGRPLYSEWVPAVAGQNSLYYNTKDLGPGIYIISVKVGGKKVAKRLVVY